MGMFNRTEPTARSEPIMACKRCAWWRPIIDSAARETGVVVFGQCHGGPPPAVDPRTNRAVWANTDPDEYCGGFALKPSEMTR